jgi:hypothetical protein
VRWAIGCGLVAIASCFPRLGHAQALETGVLSLEQGDAAAPPRASAVPQTPHASEAPAHLVRTRYGLEILLSDAISLSVASIGLVAASNERAKAFGPSLVLLGMASYELAPSAIHWAHARPAMMPASLGLRFGLTTTGLLVGAFSRPCPPSNNDDVPLCGSAGAVLGGFLGGAVIASAIDSALFARDNPAPAAEASRFGVAPTLSIAGKSGGVSVFGAF